MEYTISRIFWLRVVCLAFNFWENTHKACPTNDQTEVNFSVGPQLPLWAGPRLLLLGEGAVQVAQGCAGLIIPTRFFFKGAKGADVGNKEDDINLCQNLVCQKVGF